MGASEGTSGDGSESQQAVLKVDFSVLYGLAISAIIYTGVILLLMTGNWFFYRRFRSSYYDDEYDDYDAGKAPATQRSE
jgi:hypothetical protein